MRTLVWRFLVRNFCIADLYGGSWCRFLYGGFVWRINIADLGEEVVWTDLYSEFWWRFLVRNLYDGFVWRICMTIFSDESLCGRVPRGRALREMYGLYL